MLATGVIREHADDAYTGGVDYNLRWDQNRTGLNGHWVATHAPGDNGMRTSGGGLANFTVSRKHWSVWAHADRFGRDFRVSDIGFFRVRANRNDVDGGLTIEQPDPGRALRRYGVTLCGGRGWNHEVVFDRWVCTNGFVGFLNFWEAQGGVTRRFRTLNDVDTRGGPPIVDPPATYYFFNINTDSRKGWRVTIGGNGKRGSIARDGETALGATLTLQPSGRLQAAVSTRVVRGTDIAQWIENSDVTGDGIDDPIYGTLRRSVIDITLRGTYALHRDLTLQAYLQPFVAVGDYDHIRRLAVPRSFAFEPAQIAEDPDFNRKSLRGNVVLRWEYVRGSTLFVVWDLSTEDTCRPGVFSPLRDLGSTFDTAARHVVMAKITCWLNR